MDILRGHAYILGDNINTDDIVPSHTLTMRDANEMAKCTLEFIDPEFVKNVDKEDIIFAGENFGSGSSREEAVNVFKILGIKAIIAKSFSRIYFRNAINKGLPVIKLDWDNKLVVKGDEILISLKDGKITNQTKNVTTSFVKLPEFLTKILEAGGILNQLKDKLSKK